MSEIENNVRFRHPESEFHIHFYYTQAFTYQEQCERNVIPGIHKPTNYRLFIHGYEPSTLR